MINLPPRPNTLQAIRQIIVDALTDPLLTYKLDDGKGDLVAHTVPADNVIPATIWQAGATPAMPMVAFSLRAMPDKSRFLYGEREFTLKLWVVSKVGEDEVTQIYAAIFDRLQYADQDSPRDLSRQAVGNKLGASIRLCREVRALPPAYEPESSRWNLSADYQIAAV